MSAKHPLKRSGGRNATSKPGIGNVEAFPRPRDWAPDECQIMTDSNSALHHPAALPCADLLKACGEARTKRSGPGGQHRNTVETAVILVHQPTGISADASERRSQAENRNVALTRLRLKLALEHRTPADPSGPSRLWRSRNRARQLVISAYHEDYPSLVTEALDQLQVTGFEIAPAAEKLGVSGTQLVRLFKKSPVGWATLNKHRTALTLPALK
jgi:hypothetical protein